MEETKKRIKYLDGIKGICAIIVVLSHLVLAFYPVLHTNFQKDLNNQNIIVKLIASTPLNIIYSGHFAVMAFFLISGYVLSYKYFITLNKRDYLTSVAFRRYFRLMFPAFFSCILAYLLLHFDLFFNITASPKSGSGFLNIPYHFKADFLNMVKFALYDEFFQFNFKTGYNNVLWIMRYELFGSLLIFSFLALFGHTHKRFFCYFILALACYNNFYLAFILGSLLCDLKLNGKKLKSDNKLVLFILLFIGIYLSSFQSYHLSFYSILNISTVNNIFGKQFIASFYNIAGTSLLLIVIMNSGFLQKILSSTVVLFLGKISFSIYLVHTLVICSLSSYIYVILIERNFSFESSFIITSIVSILVIIPTSLIFDHFIEKKSINWSNKLYSFFIR